MLNSVNVVGRLCRDVELRRTQSGSIVTTINIAINKTVNGVKNTIYIPCVAWGKTAELISKYFHKGSLIGITGELSSRTYTNDNGKNVFVLEVVVREVTFLESKSSKSPNADVTSDTTVNNGNLNNSVPSGADGQFAQAVPSTINDAFGAEYDTPELDIASDDLPF